jgi:RluA family pseudouridine synthase
METATAISVLYEDDHLLAVDKPEGMPSIPEKPGKNNDLLTVLSARSGRRLYVIHRLDKGATGVILFGKTEEAYRFVGAQFAERRVRKSYVALAHGRVAPETGTIDKPLRKFGSGRMGVDFERGLPALTRYRVREQFAAHALLDLEPTSGRKHQLRVHLLSIDHPIVGDRWYGSPRLQNGFERLMLHAARLEFDVVSKRRLTLEAPLSESFISVVEQCRWLAPAPAPES